MVAPSTLNNAERILAAANGRGLQALLQNATETGWRPDMTAAEKWELNHPIAQLADQIALDSLELHKQRQAGTYRREANGPLCIGPDALASAFSAIQKKTNAAAHPMELFFSRAVTGMRATRKATRDDAFARMPVLEVNTKQLLACLLSIQSRMPDVQLWEASLLYHCGCGTRGVELLNHSHEVRHGQLYISLAKKKGLAPPQQRGMVMGIRAESVVQAYDMLQNAIPPALRVDGQYSDVQVRDVMKHFDCIGNWRQHCFPMSWLMFAYEKHWKDLATDFTQHMTRAVYVALRCNADGIRNLTFYPAKAAEYLGHEGEGSGKYYCRMVQYPCMMYTLEDAMALNEDSSEPAHKKQKTV